MAPARSSLQRMLLTAVLGLAAACATAPLSPPVVEPVREAPEEFRWLSFRWPDGAVLSYVTETSIETVLDERVKTTRQRHRFRMSSMGSVVSGVRRVRIAFNDVDIADAMLDEDGHLKDIFISMGGAEPMIDELRATLVRASQHPLQKRLESAALRLNESFTGDVLLSDVFAPMMTPVTTPESATRLTVTYTGRKRANGGVAAELLTSYVLASNTSYRLAFRESKAQIEVSSMRGDSRDYLDPERHYRILSDDVLTAGGVGAGKRWTAKQVTVTTLDRAASRGI